MDIIKPSKDRVRQYMAERSTAKTPPQEPADVRRELGWLLAPNNSTTSTAADEPAR